MNDKEMQVYKIEYYLAFKKKTNRFWPDITWDECWKYYAKWNCPIAKKRQMLERFHLDGHILSSQIHRDRTWDGNFQWAEVKFGSLC